jgi:TonB family protein
MKSRIILVACVFAILNNGCVSTPQNNAASMPIQKTTFSGTVQAVYQFYSLNADCTPNGSPTVEVLKAPSHGSIQVENVEGFTGYPSTNQRYECNKQKSPIVAVAYISEKAFVGTDIFTLKGIFPSGNTTTKEFVVSVEDPKSTSLIQPRTTQGGQLETSPKSVNLYTPPRFDPAQPPKVGADYYPPESLLAREQGGCLLALTVAADGGIKDARILQGSGYPRLDKACLDAFEGGHLIPATSNGVPIEMTIPFQVTWKLAN